MKTIWLVLQHSDSDIMAYFYSDLKRYSDRGLVDKAGMATLEDQLLMFHGYKQIYGTQVRVSGLYDLEDPTNVNKRRATVGLGPIEEFLAKWRLNFADELKRMETEG